MNKTNIEYLEFTWNPLAMRCTPVSEGCKHCWHIQMANRLAKNPSILFNESNAYSGLEKPYLVRSRLDQPIKRKKPARIGVQFMGDLFHDQITYEQQIEIFHVIAEASWHTLLILTKRAKDMADFIQSIEDWEWCHFQHVWWGVSISSDKDLWMLKILLQIPAAKRFVSIEPMLGPVDLRQNWVDYLIGWTTERECCGHGLRMEGQCCGNPEPVQVQTEKLDWVIIGGLSLPGGKVQAPDPEWIADIERQCDEAGVPLFLKDNAQYHRTRQEFPV